MPRFFLHETYIASACFFFYLVMHMFAYFLQAVDGKYPVHVDGAQAFTVTCLAWVSAIGMVTGFTILTIFELIKLVRRLARDI